MLMIFLEFGASDVRILYDVAKECILHKERFVDWCLF